MKLLRALLFLIAFSLSSYALQAEKIRVACLGDSITAGSGLKDKKNDSYPAQLGKMLGDQYDVRNFGVSGRTMLRNGDRPIIKEKAYQKALAFNPNILIIKLGTNDTKPQNWGKLSNEFASDTRYIIDEFSKLSSKPEIYLCRPVPVYKTRWGINEKDLTEGVIPKINEVAKEKGCTIIDLYKALSGNPKVFPDKIHPNKEGARLMALEVKRVITAKE